MSEKTEKTDNESLRVLACEMELYAEHGAAPDEHVLRRWAEILREATGKQC